MALEVRIRWIEGMLSLGQAGKQTLTIDRAAHVGGTEAGFAGGDLLLLAVGGCLTSTLIGAASTRDITLVRLETHVAATPAQNPSRFARIDVRVDVAATHAGVALADDELDKLVVIAERGCTVSNTVRGGTELIVRRVGVVAETDVTAAP